MKVIFRNDRTEVERGEGLSRTSLDLWGVHFKMGEVVDVSHLDPKLQAKLRTNHHFEVVEEGRPKKPAAQIVKLADTETRTAGSGGKGQKRGTVKAGKE